MATGATFGGFMLLVLIFALYFLPTIIAVNRKKKNQSAIFLLNLFLGWTIIGWVIALVWSTMHEEGKKSV